jgi:endonuclease/exonuclease/phosphatase (EEP) superfamily protein YafD
MGNSSSKTAASGAKSAARHFPSAASIQERTGSAAAATALHANATAKANAVHPTTSSPKQDYLAQQRQLEEEIARYDQELSKSDRLGKKKKK